MTRKNSENTNTHIHIYIYISHMGSMSMQGKLAIDDTIEENKPNPTHTQPIRQWQKTHTIIIIMTSDDYD